MNTPKIGLNLIVDFSLKYLLAFQNLQSTFFKFHDFDFYIKDQSIDFLKAEYLLLSFVTKTNKYVDYINLENLATSDQMVIKNVYEKIQAELGLIQKNSEYFKQQQILYKAQSIQDQTIQNQKLQQILYEIHQYKQQNQKQLKFLNDYFLEPELYYENQDNLIQRYNNYGCFEHSRVQIQSDRRINANWINSLFEENKIKQHILTQGPLESTQADFWDMVMEHDIDGIVAISEDSDIGNSNGQYVMNNQRKKLSQYWPTRQGQKAQYQIPKDLNDMQGQYQYFKIYLDQHPNTYTIKRNEEAQLKDQLYYQAELTVEQKTKQTDKTKQKTVFHYHLNDWKDHDSLGESKLNDYIKLVKKLATSGKKYVLHCSAGIGRSGTLLTSIFLYNYINNFVVKFKEYKDKQSEDQQIEKPQLQLSLFETVRILRMQRNGAIQTNVQYFFLYKVIQHMLKNVRTIFGIDIDLKNEIEQLLF